MSDVGAIKELPQTSTKPREAIGLSKRQEPTDTKTNGRAAQTFSPIRRFSTRVEDLRRTRRLLQWKRRQLHVRKGTSLRSGFRVHRSVDSVFEKAGDHEQYVCLQLTRDKQKGQGGGKCENCCIP
ncbi:Toxoplasma gondii family E protein [Toxoplasma gondii TgCatPRC2]|uniref:Toxoplasma gondii family E protein n=3 Tax=Toxoplasma gondii TaxID=5811 RepID=A0A151H9W6_TOXGO|nr:hypothetical protein TGDOM2_399590 [Toxoplasma gondii GAB2-2007-GAL-DOM2]KYF39910.1 Toxoplasma gondii family E protein [Toxoplasma gondii ARI]KYK66102.1 Toxoplasma gondii family E protein [Toxoplasma gondii TgCatPRC2]